MSKYEEAMEYFICGFLYDPASGSCAYCERYGEIVAALGLEEGE